MPAEYLQGNLDVAAGHVDVEWSGALVESSAEPGEPGEHALGAEQAGLPADCEVDGRVIVGSDVEVGEGVRIDGPCIIGDAAKIGDGARIKTSVLLPNAEVPAELPPRGRDRGALGLLTTEAK